MQRVEIDCQTKEIKLVEISEAEILERTSEITQRELIEAKKAIKKSLARQLAELREMKQQRAIFTQEDLDDKQTEIDELIASLFPAH